MPPPTDSISHWAPITAVSGAPTSASASGIRSSTTIATPITPKPTTVSAAARRSGAAIAVDVAVVEPIGGVAGDHDVDGRRQHDRHRVDDGQEALDVHEVARRVPGDQAQAGQDRGRQQPGRRRHRHAGQVGGDRPGERAVVDHPLQLPADACHQSLADRLGGVDQRPVERAVARQHVPALIEGRDALVSGGAHPPAQPDVARQPDQRRGGLLAAPRPG